MARGPLTGLGFGPGHDFDRTVKRAGAGIGLWFLASWLFGLLFSGGLLALAIYVAYHFISKHW